MILCTTVGVYLATVSALLSRSPVTPEPFAARTHAFCSASDPFCNFAKRFCAAIIASWPLLVCRRLPLTDQINASMSTSSGSTSNTGSTPALSVAASRIRPSTSVPSLDTRIAWKWPFSAMSSTSSSNASSDSGGNSSASGCTFVGRQPSLPTTSLIVFLRSFGRPQRPGHRHDAGDPLRVPQPHHGGVGGVVRIDRDAAPLAEPVDLLLGHVLAEPPRAHDLGARGVHVDLGERRAAPPALGGDEGAQRELLAGAPPVVQRGQRQRRLADDGLRLPQVHVLGEHVLEGGIAGALAADVRQVPRAGLRHLVAPEVADGPADRRRQVQRQHAVQRPVVDPHGPYSAGPADASVRSPWTFLDRLAAVGLRVPRAAFRRPPWAFLGASVAASWPSARPSASGPSCAS